MKKHWIILGLAWFWVPANSQYYYKDILAAKETSHHFENLLKNNIRRVSVQAFETDGTLIEDFILRQEINKSSRTITTFSKSNSTDGSILETRFGGTLLPVSVLDSADGATTRTKYTYNPQNQLVTLSSRSVQSEQMQNVLNEERQYSYTEQGQPAQMLRLSGQADTMVVKFIPSENGQPGEEEWWKDGYKIETWYYYYDERSRLTDIVRFNAAAKKMLPDNLFGYDEDDNLTSKVNVQPVTGQFRIWQYQYDHRGLKVEETVKNKQREPEGKLVYTYQ